MVLNDVSSVAPEGFSDDAPDSDSDPYSSLGASSPSLSLDPSKFPQPFPVIGPIFGYNSQLLNKLVNRRIEAATKLLDRPTTEDEATAIAYWTAKQIAVTSWGAPLGIAAGAWRAYQTADSFRFPFYKPEPDTFRALAWPSARVALLSAPRAVAAWHATRLLAYGFVGSFFGQILLTSYGMSVSTVGEISDPRLKNFVESLRKAAQSARGRLPNETQRLEKVGVQEKDATTVWKDRIREKGDNDSPDNKEYGDTKSSENPAIVEDATMPDLNTKHPEGVARSSRQAYPENYHAEKLQPEKQPALFDENFDDASPTTGRKVENAEAATGSTWERIRQQASGQVAEDRRSKRSAGQAQQAARPNQYEWRRDSQRRVRDEYTSRDGISYSKSEEDRQLARDEAQKEFDARVEQERRGGDFSADNANQKQW